MSPACICPRGRKSWHHVRTMRRFNRQLALLRRSRRFAAASFVVVSSACMWSASAIGSYGKGTVFPVSHPVIAQAKIACFHPKKHRYTFEVEPANCEIAGQKIDGRGFVRAPVRGIDWEEWGIYKTFGHDAINLRTHRNVRVMAYRRVRCPGGATWYSQANVFDLENGYNLAIRLPVCGDDVLIR